MGTQRDKAGLIAEVNSVITTNAANGITGAILNEVLDDYTESCLILSESAAQTITSALTVTGAFSPSTSININSTIAVVGTIDDDTMATATATNIATSESIVAYIAAQDYVSTVGTPANNQIGVWTGDGTLEGDSDFLWTGQTMTMTLATAVTDIGLEIKHTGSSASESAFILLQTESTGQDPYIKFNINGGSTPFYMGVDNDDTDAFMISRHASQLSNPIIKIDQSDNIICPAMPTSSAGLPSGALWSNSGVITIV